MAGRKPKKRTQSGNRSGGRNAADGPTSGGQRGRGRSSQASPGGAGRNRGRGTDSRGARDGGGRDAGGTDHNRDRNRDRNNDGAGRSSGEGGRSGGSSSRRRRPAKGLGGDQVEGRQAVRELLLAGKRNISEVLMIEDMADADVLSDIEDLSHEFGVSLRKISRRHMGSEALTESHQGVIAKAAPVAEVDFDRLMADPAAFLLVLDGITDPGNLGAILRTAECAGVTGVVLGRHRSVHISPTVTKTAAGAVEHVPLALVGGIPTAISQLNDAGVFTVGLDGGGDRSIFELPQLNEGPTALVLGAEGAGLSRLVRQRVGVVASIPLAGQLNSLNVATATAVACFEVVRARGTQSVP